MYNSSPPQRHLLRFTNMKGVNLGRPKFGWIPRPNRRRDGNPVEIADYFHVIYDAMKLTRIDIDRQL